MQAFAALSAPQAVRLMNQGALVIDLRSKDLYDAGHIVDARNVPAAELESQAETLKKWRDRNVITYCDSGANGAGAARTLIKLGFTKVFNLQGGLNAWVKDNLPLAKTRPGARAVRNDVSRPSPFTFGLVSVLPASQRLVDAEKIVFNEIDVDDDAKSARGDDRAQRIGAQFRRFLSATSMSAGAMTFIALDRSGELDRLIQGAG